MSENLELKSVSEILEKDFYIPSYQRGYRWDTRQVEDLLEDILEFSKRKERNLLKPKEFYCLQPIVVKYDEINKHYRVIDGQQRLTTILIILKYLESKIQDDYYIDSFYSITYETRNNKDENSWEFLQKINTIDVIYQQNIDVYYMSKAYLSIKNWFISKKINKSDFVNILLKNDIQNENNAKVDYANNVRIIWYEIKDENEVDVFTRLNIGKIPLTNAELIKALLLLDKTKVKINEKIILATQWDNIEYKLQNDTFFAFINGKVNEYKKATKIEFIFDLIVSNIKLKIDNLKEDDIKYSYYIFDRLLNDQNEFKEEFGEEISEYDQRVEFLWDKVKTYFRIFEELYIDNTYYHLVGYLVNNNKNINDILRKFESKTKDKFLDYLKEEISEIIKFKKDDTLKNISYQANYNLITNILFLFNVISTMKAGYSKYPFDLHKQQNWSLEHIHAQNPEEIKDDKDRKFLLEDQKKYIEDKKLHQAIEKLIQKKKVEDDEFNKIQEKVFKLYSDNSNIHTLDNMALLSKEDNSALNNSIFPSKRDKIKELDAKGSFIPIGTKNVFLKYYSNNVMKAIQWNSEDRKKYLIALKEILKDYIKEVHND